nr:hypothetical protein [Tanacetum cinerariifolium]
KNASVRGVVKDDKYTLMELDQDLFQQDNVIDAKDYTDMVDELQQGNEDVMFGNTIKKIRIEDTLPSNVVQKRKKRKEIKEKIRIYAIETMRSIKVKKCDTKSMRAYCYGPVGRVRGSMHMMMTSQIKEMLLALMDEAYTGSTIGDRGALNLKIAIQSHLIHYF